MYKSSLITSAYDVSWLLVIYICNYSYSCSLFRVATAEWSAWEVWYRFYTRCPSCSNQALNLRPPSGNSTATKPPGRLTFSEISFLNIVGSLKAFFFFFEMPIFLLQCYLEVCKGSYNCQRSESTVYGRFGVCVMYSYLLRHF